MGIVKVDVIENAGDNWLIADFGTAMDGKHYIVTTDYVHASDLGMLGDAKDQAELVCELLNEHWRGRLPF